MVSAVTASSPLGTDPGLVAQRGQLSLGAMLCPLWRGATPCPLWRGATPCPLWRGWRVLSPGPLSLWNCEVCRVEELRWHLFCARPSAPPDIVCPASSVQTAERVRLLSPEPVRNARFTEAQVVPGVLCVISISARAHAGAWHHCMVDGRPLLLTPALQSSDGCTGVGVSSHPRPGLASSSWHLTAPLGCGLAFPLSS